MAAGIATARSDFDAERGQDVADARAGAVAQHAEVGQASAISEAAGQLLRFDLDPGQLR